MTNKQEIRAKALELAIKQLSLYQPILENIYKNSLSDDPTAFVKGNGFLGEITCISAKYEDLLSQV
jgi:hypothetical protein